MVWIIKKNVHLSFRASLQNWVASSRWNADCDEEKWPSFCIQINSYKIGFLACLLIIQSCSFIASISNDWPKGYQAKVALIFRERYSYFYCVSFTRHSNAIQRRILLNRMSRLKNLLLKVERITLIVTLKHTIQNLKFRYSKRNACQ